MDIIECSGVARAMSGEVEQLLRINVGLSGPKYWGKIL